MRSVPVGFALVLLVGLASCEQRLPDKAEQPGPVFSQQCDYMVVVVPDVSGSFNDILEKRGFPLLLATCDHLFSSRVASNDRLVIGRIGGTERVLLWDGPPLALRESFASARHFRQFLETQAGGGSRVYDSVADAVTYCMDFPGVAKEKTCVMVLSDMDDNFPDSDKARTRMLTTLSDYAKKGGSIGFYFVDEREVPRLRKDLAACGFKYPPVVESIIAVSPALPRFSE